jgi:hypothetical protein
MAAAAVPSPTPSPSPTSRGRHTDVFLRAGEQVHHVVLEKDTWVLATVAAVEKDDSVLLHLPGGRPKKVAGVADAAPDLAPARRHSVILETPCVAASASPDKSRAMLDFFQEAADVCVVHVFSHLTLLELFYLKQVFLSTQA